MPGVTADPTVVMEAVANGELTEEELDQNVARILELAETYAAPECYDMSAQYIMDMSKQAAYKTACEGIVMLKMRMTSFRFRQRARQEVIRYLRRLWKMIFYRVSFFAEAELSVYMTVVPEVQVLRQIRTAASTRG